MHSKFPLNSSCPAGSHLEARALAHALAVPATLGVRYSSPTRDRFSINARVAELDGGNTSQHQQKTQRHRVGIPYTASTTKLRNKTILKSKR